MLVYNCGRVSYAQTFNCGSRKEIRMPVRISAPAFFYKVIRGARNTPNALQQMRSKCLDFPTYIKANTKIRVGQ